MQKQNNFKYLYKGEEVSKEQFNTLAKNGFKWFNNNSINAVDFDSVSSFFDGDFKSQAQVNDHFKGVLFGFDESKTTDFYKESPRKENLDKMCENFEKRVGTMSEDVNRIKEFSIGKKESKTVEKAPIFTYCKQMKNAIEVLSLRSLYGHKRYEKGDDWENFARVENGQFEYSNAAFRHALGIGEEDEKNHLVAEAWNSVAKLELFLRKNLVESK